MNIKVVTSKFNDDLYDLSQALYNLPYERIAFPGKDTRLFGAKYIYKALTDVEADIVVMMDEDVFIIDNGALSAFIEEFAHSDYDLAGAPDGGMIDIRINNPLCINPFFCVLRRNKLLALLNAEEINKVQIVSDELKKKTPVHLLKPDKKYNYNFNESYNHFFIWLHMNNVKFNFMDMTEHTDKISSYILYNNKPLLLHTWYAREYNRNKDQHDRIDLRFNEIKK